MIYLVNNKREQGGQGLTVDRAAGQQGSRGAWPTSNREYDPEIRFGRQICDNQDPLQMPSHDSHFPFQGFQLTDARTSVRRCFYINKYLLFQ